jgi:hypothetical protein
MTMHTRRNAPPPSDLDDEFGSWDAEAAEQERADAQADGKYFTFDVGENAIRILPPPVGGKSPFFTYHQHVVDVVDNENKPRKMFFVCPERTTDAEGNTAPCAVCAEGRRLESSGNRHDGDAARGYFPSKRAAAWILNRNISPDRQRPVLCEMPFKTVYMPIVNMGPGKRGGCNFTHPITGRDVLVDRTGTQMTDTRYTARLDTEPTQMAPTLDRIRTMLAGLPPLASQLRWLSPDDIETVMNGYMPEDQGEAQAAQEARAVTRKPAPALPQERPGRAPAAAPRAAVPARAKVKVHTAQDDDFIDLDDDLAQ